MSTSRSDPHRSICVVESYAPDDHVTVKLVGELDASSRPAIEHKLFDVAGSADMTIDLARVTIADLDSVRLLARCRERARANGRSLAIVNAPAEVERALEMLERGDDVDREQLVPRHDGHGYAIPGPTNVDAERSQPESEQIVRLQCPVCGNQAFRPERSPKRACEKCGGWFEVVAVFRDRRRMDTSVDVDRRQ